METSEQGVHVQERSPIKQYKYKHTRANTSPGATKIEAGGFSETVEFALDTLSTPITPTPKLLAQVR
jgi:hypothetical protein